VGQVVWIYGYVIDIKRISSSRGDITLSDSTPDSCVTVILSGKGAYKNAIRLQKRAIAEAKGRIKITNGKPWMTVTDFRRLKMLDCTCLLSEKKTDVLVDTVAFPNERVKKHGEN
jgi:hypothetical protein